MKNCYHTSYLIFLVVYALCGFLQPLQAQGPVSNQADSVFEQGMEALNNGNQREAVEIWASALNEDSDAGYKFGYHFLKTVSANNIRNYYEQASQYYYRGLDAAALDDDDFILIKNDVEFIKPLLGRREGNHWDDLIEERDPRILQEISDFWDSMRITISDTYNERLLEHWERRNFVENNYDTSSRSSFDDRGSIYLKFGQPAFQRDGTLLYNSGFAEYVISARMRDGGGFGGNAVETTSFLNTTYMVREYHEYPQFEVWVYRDLIESNDNVIYLFGNSSGSSVMHQMESVDDFVPSAAFNISGRNRPVTFGMINSEIDGEQSAEDDDDQDTDVAFEANDVVTANRENISPGLVLQLMYYRQMATFDDYFSSQYTDMMDRYMSTSTYLGKSIAKEFQFINTSRFLRRQDQAPDQSSSHAKELFSIESELYPYRFLDENMNPYLKIYLNADSEEAISYDELRRHNNVGQIDESRFLIVNKMEIFNEDGVLLKSELDTLRMSVNNDPLTDNLIEIPHQDDLSRLNATFELHNEDLYGDNSISDQTTFRKYLMGMGNSESDVNSALDGSSFTSSDIILGYTANDDSSDGRFSIAHDAEIPFRQNLNLYYEAYNLPVNEDGLYSYTLTYEISKQRSWLGNLVRFGKSGGPSITIDNVNDESRFSQSLEIVSQELEKGDYTLRLTFEAPDEEIIQTKEIEFQII